MLSDNISIENLRMRFRIDKQLYESTQFCRVLDEFHMSFSLVRNSYLLHIYVLYFIDQASRSQLSPFQY